MLTGPSQVGKTMALAYIARELFLARGPRARDLVRYIEVGEFADALYDDSLADKLPMLYRVPLLLLDDFGAGYLSEYGLGRLERLLTKRDADMLSTVVASNVSAAELEALGGQYQRIIKRWQNRADWIECAEGDKR